ncbi:MAG: GNAT family N-acetyltransferase [Verrucomicrobia bacterium]|nr:GNAT family N-acetyltransferase [Verrucomicrobiota bacterium]
MRCKSATPLQIPLRGKKIFLRPPRTGDYREYAHMMKANVKAYRSLVPRFKGRKQFDDYLNRCRRDDFFGFLICRNEDRTIVGNINLFHIIRRGLQSACLGYLIGASYARQGFATEALRLMIRFAFTKVRLHRVEADIQPGNIPSIALVRRAGFSCEGLSRRYVKIAGRWRDHERWALLAEDWRGIRHK